MANGFAAFPFIISDSEHAGGTSSAGKDSRRMKKKAALLPLLLGVGIMFTACGANNAQNGNGQNEQNGQNTGSSANQTGAGTNGGTSVNNTTGTNPGNGNGSVIGDNNARTGDVDGDGIIEDIVTGAEDVVNGAARGADNILEDITPGERDNATQTTTVNR